MPLAVGVKLGPYEIIAAIGNGGMGEAWKARDTRLDRVVAIKFCAAAFSERFGREAKAIAALNHSSICQIYDVGPDYIVMEYVEGTPITPVDTPRKLLDIAVQMTDGRRPKTPGSETWARADINGRTGATRPDGEPAR